MQTQRIDRKGNIFSDIHYKLGWHLYLSDIDFLQGSIKSGFANINISENTENSLYGEYFTENDEAVTVAIYDYKHVLSEYQKQQLNEFKTGKSAWYYSQLARKLDARSFIIYADNGELPLTFVETTNGKPKVVGVLLSDEPFEIKKFWRETLKM